MSATSTTRHHRRSRLRRVLLENLTAYLFLLPAALLIVIFGLFPVMFAFFVSLYRWRRFPDEYIGLGNYQRAMGDLVYIVFFWAAIAALIAGIVLLWRFVQQTRSHPNKVNGLLVFGAAVINSAAIFQFVRWFALLLPVVLDIPRRLRGQERTQGLFVNELFSSFGTPGVAEAGTLTLVIVIAAIAATVLLLRRILLENSGLLWRSTGSLLLLLLGGLTMQLTLDSINAAIETARAAGTELPVWSQIIIISAGFGLLGVAYWLWQHALRQSSDRRLLLGGLGALVIMVGGYILIAELPRMVASADRFLVDGFSVTVMYAVGAVPFQLAIGLGLAYLLFQNLKGKTFFRMVFFLPYIMPFLATALVFKLLFSHREDSIINQIVGAVGVTPQKWLLEPLAIGNLIFGSEFPQGLAGPSLALVVVIIFSIWTYAGYDTVVFLAGLGNIPGELYEAARIDGASGWAIFRNLTLPLLSPTTFFLSLVAVIGTFQAFTQLWLMRSPAARNTMDTVSIYIFKTITDANVNYGYGSALAFVLFAVILLLTLFQNRLAGRRVFYG
ncbi:MAG: ABC transporter permease subunit [Anaerolineae bacterium]